MVWFAARWSSVRSRSAPLARDIPWDRALPTSAVSIVRGPVRVREAPLARRLALPQACALVGALITFLLWVLLVPGIDAPSHLFQTWLFSHGGWDLYNNYWYAGRYEFVNYSMLYYVLAAEVGQLGVLVPSAALM